MIERINQTDLRSKSVLINWSGMVYVNSNDCSDILNDFRNGRLFRYFEKCQEWARKSERGSSKDCKEDNRIFEWNSQKQSRFLTDEQKRSLMERFDRMLCNAVVGICRRKCGWQKLVITLVCVIGLVDWSLSSSSLVMNVSLP